MKVSRTHTPISISRLTLLPHPELLFTVGHVGTKRLALLCARLRVVRKLFYAPINCLPYAYVASLALYKCVDSHGHRPYPGRIPVPIWSRISGSVVASQKGHAPEVLAPCVWGWAQAPVHSSWLNTYSTRFCTCPTGRNTFISALLHLLVLVRSLLRR